MKSIATSKRVSTISAILHQRLGRYEESEKLQRRVLAIREKLLEPGHIALLDSTNALANLRYQQGKYEEAEPMYQRALALAEEKTEDESKKGGVQNWGKDGVVAGMILTNLGLNSAHLGRYDEAENLHRRALHILEQNFGGDHPLIPDVYVNLASSLTPQGEYAEAETVYRRALAISEKIREPPTPRLPIL